MLWICVILMLICLTMTVWAAMVGSILAAVFGVATISMVIITYFAWEAQSLD